MLVNAIMVDGGKGVRGRYQKDVRKSYYYVCRIKGWNEVHTSFYDE